MDRIIEKKRWSVKKISTIVAIGIITVFLVYQFGFRDKRSRLNIDQERLVISTVQKGEFKEFIRVIGTVIPIKTYYLDAKEGGSVEARYLEAGSYVDKGDPILKLANTNLLLDIMYREAELFQQSNNLRNTRLAMEQNALTLKAQIRDLDYEISQAEREYNNQLNPSTYISFGTQEASDRPSLSNVYPAEGSVNIELQPTCSIKANDVNGDTLTVEWYENTSGWTLRQTNNSVLANSTVTWVFNQASNYNTKYWWSVNVTDGTYWTNQTFSFTTEEEIITEFDEWSKPEMFYKIRKDRDVEDFSKIYTPKELGFTIKRITEEYGQEGVKTALENQKVFVDSVLSGKIGYCLYKGIK